jgi:hypothetical protein
MKVVTPVAPFIPEAAIERPSRRIDTDVPSWGFVDTSKVNSAAFLSFIEKLLAPAEQTTVTIRKPAPGYALSPDEVSHLSDNCGAVLIGFGDCGTSTYYAVRDAAQIERTGIPAVVVCSDAFADPARALGSHFGLSDLRVVVLPHPLASRSRDEIEQLAEQAAPAVRAAIRQQSQTRQDPPAGLLPRTELATDVHAAQEQMHRLGWTDGLPVVPPLEELVASLVDVLGNCTAHDVMAPIPPARARASLETWAANAVMAGCLPEHFPVALAAMEALLDPSSGLASSQVATNTSAPLLILNGPVRNAIEAESRYSCLGSGNRANAAIGRSVRLILRNVGGELPGVTDLATHGQPGKFTYCLAENEEESPWEPWHVSKGFPPDASTVTAIMASPPQNIFAYGSNTSAELIDQLVGALTGLGHNNILFDTGPLLVLSPEHAHLLAKTGLQRLDLQNAIYEQARIPLSRLPVQARERLQTRRRRWFELHPLAETVGVADRPADVHIIVAGGPGIHSQFISTAFSEQAVTKSVSIPAHTEGTQQLAVGTSLSRQ